MNEGSGYDGRPVLLGTGITFSILPLAVVILRLCACRRSRTTRLSRDDWIFWVPGLLLCIALAITQMIQAQEGVRPSSQTPESTDGVDALTTYGKCKYILQILGPLALSLTRLCILLFSRRSSTGTKNTRIINNVLVTMGLLWGVVFSLVFAFQCAPVSAMWTPFESNASRGCIDQRAAEIAFAASDIALVVALVVSVSSLLQVKPSRREEAIALVGASILGLSILGLSTTRLAMLISPLQSSSPLWTLLETSLGLSLAIILPLISPPNLSDQPLLLSKSSSASPSSASFSSSTKNSHQRHRVMPLSGSNESLTHNMPIGFQGFQFQPPGHAHITETRVETVSLRSVPREGIRVRNDFWTGSMVVVGE